MGANTSEGATIFKGLLNKENYKEWSTYMKNYLLAHDLWNVIREDRPEPPTGGWIRMNAAAFHSILISCGKEAVDLILDCSSAEDSARYAWDTLASAFNSDTSEAATIVKELLNKENHKEWSVYMKNYLLAHNLWNVIKEDRPKPPTGGWIRKNAAAFHSILISCGKEAVDLILDCSPAEDSAKDAWDTLASAFNSGGEIAKVLLHNKNYKEWRVCMKSYLLARNLWDIVKSSASESDNSSKIDVWETMNTAAFDAILKSCGTKAQHLISDCSSVENSARDAWNKLASAYNSGAAIVDELLNHENYKRWSVGMKSYLVNKDLWCVVKNGYKKPPKSASTAAGDDGNDKIVADTSEQSNDNDVVEAIGRTENFDYCKQTNDLASHSIWISCEKEAADLILDLSSAKQAWDKLADIYDSDQNVREAEPSSNQNEIQHVIDDEKYDYDPQYQPLYEAVRIGDWLATERFLREYREALTARITFNGKTALHVAAVFMHPHIVEGLLKLMSEKDLELKEMVGCTPLARVCSVGVTQMARSMVEKNKKILTTPDAFKGEYIVRAVTRGHTQLAKYLYSVTPLEELLPERGRYGALLLAECLCTKDLDMALHLLKRCPQLAITQFAEGFTPVRVFATRPLLFARGREFPFFRRLIYHLINVEPAGVVNEIHIDVENPNTRASDAKREMKKIRERKLVRKQSRELLHIICQQFRTLNYKQLVTGQVFSSILLAAEFGIPEFIVEAIKANPELAWSSNNVAPNFFFNAVRYRQAEVFSLINGFIWKEEITTAYDEVSVNSLLHMAGMRAPPGQLNRISGAALQMQRELQWFKEVESVMPDTRKEFRNKDRMTARDLFTREHKDLVKEGEKWMKGTATSCTVVGALIVTIMFAAAFTVPGGNNQDTGYPMFLHQKLFMVFIISDAVSLFSSATSVLMFLGILTSRYSEDDFLKSLPTKLIIGLSLLFISIATMMAAFCAALIIMLEGKLWIVLPVIFLASVPIGLFVKLQFPLLVEIFISTFGPGIFDRNVKRWP